jgi:hypothetical protein
MEAPVGDFLFTVAEVAVAFAGFAGLVTVLAQRLSHSQLEFDVVRFRDMLLLSLIAAAFALFPTLPAAFGASDEMTWRVSSTLFVAAWLGFGVQGLLAGFRLSQSGTRPFSRPLFWSNLAVHVPAVIALLLVAIDARLVVNVREAVYLTALFAMLYLAGAYFVALFMSLARG